MFTYNENAGVFQASVPLSEMETLVWSVRLAYDVSHSLLYMQSCRDAGNMSEYLFRTSHVDTLQNACERVRMCYPNLIHD